MPGLDPAAFQARMEDGAVVVDLRPSESAAAGYVPGAVFLQFGRADLGERAKQLLPAEAACLLVMEPAALGPMAETLLSQAGFQVEGFLAGGMAAWSEAGFPTETLDTMQAAELHQALQSGQSPAVLDVREAHEFEWGHIAGSRLLPYTEVWRRARELDPEQHWHVICDNQNRSGTAASILRRLGFRRVTLVLGGTHAWSEAGYPLSR